jgi:RNA polymerase sigma factor (sigma-70 family)
VSHPDFERPNASKSILAPCPGESANGATKVNANNTGLLSYLNGLGCENLLSKEQEEHLFRKMNFLKFQAVRLQARRGQNESRTSQIADLVRQADAVRDRIIRSNLRLVVSIAKKYVNASNSLDELISEGNLSLLQAVEKFDISRGNRFSTYATRALRNNFYHYVTDKHRRKRHVGHADEELLDGIPASESIQHQDELRLDEIRRALGRIMSRLD